MSSMANFHVMAAAHHPVVGSHHESAVAASHRVAGAVGEPSTLAVGGGVSPSAVGAMFSPLEYLPRRPYYHQHHISSSYQSTVDRASFPTFTYSSAVASPCPTLPSPPSAAVSVASVASVAFSSGVTR